MLFYFKEETNFACQFGFECLVKFQHPDPLRDTYEIRRTAMPPPELTRNTPILDIL